LLGELEKHRARIIPPTPWKVKLWHELPAGRWNGEAACETYRGPIMGVLRKNFGARRSYTVLEDNDPTGYKCNAAKAVKAELGLVTRICKFGLLFFSHRFVAHWSRVG
jgi:hypothetical protein